MHGKPTPGAFDLVPPGEEFMLYRGTGAIGEFSGETKVWMLTGHRFGLRWQIESAAPNHTDIDADRLLIDHPQLGRVDIPVMVRSTNLTLSGSSAWGSITGRGLGDGTDLSRVVVHWFNLPWILPADGLQKDGTIWSGRWHFEACGWSFTLDSRPDLTTVLSTAVADEHEYVMTHVGQVNRSNEESFSSDELEDVLFAWQLAMSFALGRWVAPAVPVGLSAKGDRLWEQWAPWRCDTLHGHEAWWDTHTADDLKQMAAAFVEACLDPNEGAFVRHLAMHIIAANHGSTTAEGQVMLAIAGLEYMAWVNLVLTGNISEDTFFNKGGAWRIRKLLTEAQIPLEVPKGLFGLYDLAGQENWDGPQAVVQVRHFLVHPKDPKEPYRIDGLVWQAAQLLMEYGELLLLNRLQYNGKFMRRYPPNRWAHSSEPVPWTSIK